MIIKGFTDSENEVNTEPERIVESCSDEPVISVVKVRFLSIDKELPYYNDRFNLKEGDIVYVDGKYEGEPGRITNVVTNFRINLSTYKRIVAKLDLSIHGTFKNAESMMVCVDEDCLPFERFCSWVKPAISDDDEIISTGGGYCANPADILNDENVRDAIKERGVKYFCDGAVKYVSVINSQGHAIIKGTEYYQVDFTYKNGVVTDMLCDCFCMEFCKHEVALCIALDMLSNEIEDLNNFTALEKNLFYALLSYTKAQITV